MEERSPSPPPMGPAGWFTPILAVAVGLWMLLRDPMLGGFVILYGVQSAVERIAMARPAWRPINLVVGVVAAVALIVGGALSIQRNPPVGTLLIVAGIWTGLLRLFLRRVR